MVKVDKGTPHRLGKTRAYYPKGGIKYLCNNGETLKAGELFPTKEIAEESERRRIAAMVEDGKFREEIGNETESQTTGQEAPTP